MGIAILDYEVGNLGSVENALRHLGFSPKIITDAQAIEASDILVVPGQGAAGDAMAVIRSRNLADPIRRHISLGKPYLGICLGYQLLFETSEEDGGQQCLGIFKGKVQRFSSPNIKLPQMGWNQLNIANDPTGLLNEIPNPIYAYFANSYYVVPESKEIVFTTTDYGTPFASSIQTKSVLGCQFHPEKSGEIGLTILRRFIEHHA
ncbi:imidazole glycerol phosphate synthase subunit HisH [bacterium]|nr:imidazole glycerol phosphate synthase subunit HisH [bacterium]